MIMNYDDSNDTFTVSLTVEDSNDTVTKQFTLPYDESWTTVMAKIADGLSAYYGYEYCKQHCTTTTARFGYRD